MGTTAPVEPDRTNAFTAQYAKVVLTLASRLGLPVLDLNALLQEQDGWQSKLLVDGLHFTPAGQALVGRLLIELLQRTYPELGCAQTGTLKLGVVVAVLANTGLAHCV